MLRLMERMLALTVIEQSRDQELVRKAREGSHAAFDVLFQRHKQFIYNVCYSMLGSADDAVDATQAAFIQAYRAIRRFRGEAAFRSWLYRISVNVCTRMLKRERRRSLLMLRSESPAADAASGDRVWEAVLALSLDSRAVLVLFYFQGLTCSEIAEALGCSEAAVRTRLHRARVAFKKEYEEIGP